MWQRSCHEWFLNTAAIDALGITAADMAGHGAASEMVDFDAGHWWETGMNLLLPKLSPVFMSPQRLTAGLDSWWPTCTATVSRRSTSPASCGTSSPGAL